MPGGNVGKEITECAQNISEICGGMKMQQLKPGCYVKTIVYYRFTQVFKKNQHKEDG